MNTVAVFARSFGIGLVVAAPVGAMAVRCIERTLSGGRALGYATGAGIATADALYASVAAFGLTALASVMAGAQDWVRLVGGAFLVYLGLVALLSRSRASSCATQQRKRTSYGSALLLTLANPQTILMFAGIFAGAGLATHGGGWTVPVVTVVGVFAGSLAWWLVLVTVVGAVRERASDSLLVWITRASGLAIAAFGIVTVVGGARSLLGF